MQRHIELLKPTKASKPPAPVEIPTSKVNGWVEFVRTYRLSHPDLSHLAAIKEIKAKDLYTKQVKVRKIRVKKIHQCVMCKDIFTTKSNLNRHAKSQHAMANSGRRMLQLRFLRVRTRITSLRGKLQSRHPNDVEKRNENKNELIPLQIEYVELWNRLNGLKYDKRPEPEPEPVPIKRHVLEISNSFVKMMNFEFDYANDQKLNLNISNLESIKTFDGKTFIKAVDFKISGRDIHGFLFEPDDSDGFNASAVIKSAKFGNLFPNDMKFIIRAPEPEEEKA
jgi:hypothetical protein